MPENDNCESLLGIWNRVAKLNGDRIAIEDDRCALTYWEAELQASALGAELERAGVRPGEVVAVDLDRCTGWLPAYLGIWKRGAIALPLEHGNSEFKRSCLAETGARWAISADSDDMQAGRLRALNCCTDGQSLPRLENIAYILPTSGSVKEPKLAAISHSSIASVINGLSRIIPCLDDGPYLHSASFSFSSSMRQLFLPLKTGGRVRIYARPPVFDPLHLLNAVEVTKVSTLDLTPSHVKGMLYSEADRDVSTMLASVKRLIVASEVFPTSLFHRWSSVSPASEVYHLYGQTETGGAISAQRISDDTHVDRPLPLALPFAPFEAHSDAEADEACELMLTGIDPANGIIRGLQFHPHEYKRSRDGTWAYATGDLFRLRSRDEMEYAGRADWQLKILGKRIDTDSMERSIGSVGGVLSVAVVKVLRPGRDNIVVAAYSLTRGTSPSTAAVVRAEVEQAIRKFTAAVIAVEVPEIPLNRSGKVDRGETQRVLDHILREGEATGKMSDLPEEVVETWSSIIPAHLQSEDQNFFLAGGDSIAMVSVLASIYRATGKRVPPSEFLATPTLAGLRKILQRCKAAGPPSGRGPPAAASPLLQLMPTPFQRGLWVAERLLDPRPSPYWLPVELTIADGSAFVDSVRFNLRKACDNFDLLTGSFGEEGESLVYYPGRFTCDQLVPDADEGGRELLASLPMMTGGSPLMRALVYQQGPDLSLSLMMHHAIADRNSIDLLLRGAFGEAIEPPIRPFRSFAKETYPDADMHEQAREYWSRLLPVSAAVRSGKHVEISRAAQHFRRAAGASGLHDITTSHAHWLHAFHLALGAHKLTFSNVIGIDVDLRHAGSTRGSVFGPAMSTVPVVLDPGMDVEHAMLRTSESIAHASVSMSTVFEGKPRPTGDPKQPFFLYKMVYQKQTLPTEAFGKPVHYRMQPDGIPENDITLFVRDFGAQGRVELAWNRHLVPDNIAQNILRDACANYISRRS